MLSLNNVNIKIKKKHILKDISYEFKPGIYGLLGPNGAGKTTLIRCLTGLYTVKQGDIYYQGNSVRNNSHYLSNIGYLPQKFGLFRDLKVYEMMQMMANTKGLSIKEAKEDIDRCVDLVNLSDRMDSKIKTLSGGMIRRLGIAQTLLGDPNILIFDEPTAGLDPEERMRFKLLISQIKSGKIILISTHIVSDIEAISDQVLVLNQGRLLASGPLSEISKYGDGKVWIVPEDELKSVQGDFVLQEKSERNGKMICRVLSSTPQNFEQDAPTLEDGYMCIMKEL